MFTVPDAPSYRATFQEWQDYLRLLKSKYTSARGVEGAIAEAQGVIEAFMEEKNDQLLAA